MEQSPPASLETTEASFVTIIMDRLHALEADNDRLKQEVQLLRTDLDTRAPPVTLLALSGFKDFSDGWSLSWKILEEPGMISDRTLQQFPQVAVPLDDAHWNAIAFPCATYIVIECIDYSMPIETHVGKFGYPVTVRMLVTKLQETLRRSASRTATLFQDGGHFWGFTPCPRRIGFLVLKRSVD
jgi:hypothetical protein